MGGSACCSAYCIGGSSGGCHRAYEIVVPSSMHAAHTARNDLGDQAEPDKVCVVRCRLDYFGLTHTGGTLGVNAALPYRQ